MHAERVAYGHSPGAVAEPCLTGLACTSSLCAASSAPSRMAYSQKRRRQMPRSRRTSERHSKREKPRTKNGVISRQRDETSSSTGGRKVGRQGHPGIEHDQSPPADATDGAADGIDALRSREVIGETVGPVPSQTAAANPQLRRVTMRAVPATLWPALLQSARAVPRGRPQAKTSGPALLCARISVEANDTLRGRSLDDAGEYRLR
jgi:hypothetical protein